MGATGAIQAKKGLYIKVLMQRNFVAEFHRENASFTRKTLVNISEPPFVEGGDAIHL